MIQSNGQNSANKASKLASILPCHKQCIGRWGLNQSSIGLAMSHVPLQWTMNKLAKEYVMKFLNL